MQRFYIENPDIKAKVIEIHDHRIVFQALKVLRMKEGSRFTIFDDNEKEFMVEVLKINSRRILGNLIEEIKTKTEPEIEIHLYQAIPKKTALFELVVQKATEIGAAHIYPLLTNHTEKHRISKFDRLFKIAIEATEQSRRTKIPTIHHPVNFEDIVSTVKNCYIGYEYEEGNTLADYLPKIKKAKKAHLFSFGPRILRTETASIAALSIVLLNK